MVNEQNRYDMLRRYVLDELTSEENEYIEERYFTDDEWLIELLSVRDDLLDDWARGALSAAEQERLFQRYAALPALRERAAFALDWQAVKQSPTQKNVSKRRFGKWDWAVSPWTLAAAAVLLVTLGGWWLSATKKHPEPLEDLASQTPSGTPSPFVTVPPQAPTSVQPHSKITPPHTASGKVLGLVLPPLTRDANAALADVPKVITTKGLRALRLQLEIELPEASSPSLHLFDATGRTVWRSNKLPIKTSADARYVLADIPMQVLPPGLYRVELRKAGQALVSQSAFQIVEP